MSISTLFDGLKLFLSSSSGEQIELSVHNEFVAINFANKPDLESAIVNLVFNAKNAQKG